MLQRLRPYVLADFCASLFPGNEELGRWLDVIILREVTLIDCQRETPARIDEAGEDIAAGNVDDTFDPIIYSGFVIFGAISIPSRFCTSVSTPFSGTTKNCRPCLLLLRACY